MNSSQPERGQLKSANIEEELSRAFWRRIMLRRRPRKALGFATLDHALPVHVKTLIMFPTTAFVRFQDVFSFPTSYTIHNDA